MLGDAVKCWRAPLALAGALLCACGSLAPAPGAGAESPGRLAVSSPQLTGGSFPVALTCDGSGQPPEVTWGPVDPATRSVVIELFDPDAPRGGFLHWLAVWRGFHGPASLKPPFPSSLTQGLNGAGRRGYTGPCPPPGQTHHYHLTVTAESSPLQLQPGFGVADLRSALAAGRSRALNEGELIATYRRA